MTKILPLPLGEGRGEGAKPEGAKPGNIQSLVGNFVYDINQKRTVFVDSRGMLEALRKVYNANKVVGGTNAVTLRAHSKSAPLERRHPCL